MFASIYDTLDGWIKNVAAAWDWVLDRPLVQRAGDLGNRLLDRIEGRP